MKDKVFVVMVEYQDFEDIDNNYSEVRLVTKDKNKAVDKIMTAFEEQIEMDMFLAPYYIDYRPTSFNEYIKQILDKWGYLEFRQQFGNGKCRIMLEEMEMI